MNFPKGFILSLAGIENLEKPLTLLLQPIFFRQFKPQTLFKTSLFDSDKDEKLLSYLLRADEVFD